jgi:Zn-finger nucleic acid-binding protein
LRCPHCRKLLVTVRAADVDLNGCAGCGGIWLDNDSAGRVIAAPSRAIEDLANRAAIGMKFERRIHAPICAECPALLDRLTSRGIDLDICAQHGTWFDAFELGRLTAVLRGEPDPKKNNLSDRWTCDGCRTSIRIVDANLTDFGMVCDRCWRDRQSELRAKSDQRIADTGSALGLAGSLVGALFAAAATPSS